MTTKTQMLKILQDIKIPVNKTRKNVGNNPKSIVLGTQKILYGGGFGKSRHNEKFASLLKSIRSFSKKYIPNYKWEAVTINDSHRATKHRDRNNTKFSYIIGLGNYTGGELTFTEGPLKGKHSIKNKFLKFQGSFEHKVEAFKGKRYTLVFYKWSR